jgi:FkbM family methyltransferase
MIETAIYAREAVGVRDFLLVMRVRLSQSKIGPLLCPRPITVDVSLRSLGPRVRLRSHTSDISVLGEIVVARNYETAASAALGARAIVDLGANTGLAARWFLERFPGARIVSVEPEAGNLAVLRHNLAPYGDRARIIAACVGGRERRVGIVGRSGDEFGFSMVEVDDGSGDIEVITMSSVLDELRNDQIDLLKCDIEGAESELFEAAGSWLPQVRILAIECHGDFTVQRLTVLLARKGVVPRRLKFEPTPQFGCEQAVFALRPDPVGPDGA